MLKPLKAAVLLVLAVLPYLLGLFAGVVCASVLWLVTVTRNGWKDGFAPWEGVNRGSAR